MKEAGIRANRSRNPSQLKRKKQKEKENSMDLLVSEEEEANQKSRPSTPRGKDQPL